MENPQRFTVAVLKDVLREFNLSLSGSKAELIRRLQEYDPTDAWQERASILHNTEFENHSGTAVEELPEGRDELYFLKRERELLLRELDLAKRENEMLRNNSGISEQRQNQPRIPGIGVIKELINEFDGNNTDFSTWKDQFKLLCTTYNLDESNSRLLLGTKLKGRALQWLYSKKEYVESSVEDLLLELSKMFDHRPSKLALRRKFEERMWKTTETFADYFHDKLILANTVPINEEEIVDYLIEGIPDESIQSQAQLHRFQDKTSLLEAFKKVSLKRDKSLNKLSRSEKTEDSLKPVIEEEKNKKQSTSSRFTRCFNCNKFGHLAPDCKMPKREKGACFRCFELGHQIQDCPNSRKEFPKDKA